jgi:hypothetical protein
MGRTDCKKGQIELIGLMIIVIIVVSVMMIYLVYKINNPAHNIKRGFVNQELAANFLITITKATVRECPEHSLADLVTDCAGEQRFYCGSEPSCTVANRTLLFILNTTMDYLGKSFNFSVEPVSKTGISYAGCSGRDTYTSAEQMFTIYPSMQRTRLTLVVCEPCADWPNCR